VSAFVADFTGAVVLTGSARAAEAVTIVDLDGGGTVMSTEAGEGEVAVSVYPWEIAVEPPGTGRQGSAQNRLACEVVSITTIANRVRLGLAAPQPLTAEITEPSARELGLRPGSRVEATWKAAATRVLRL
jgi:molybdopterin-binding protein